MRTTEARDLPPAEFAFPGPERDALNASILSGKKTATTSLLAEYRPDGSDLPCPGRLQALLDSHNEPCAIIETTAYRIVRLSEVDEHHALDEGEGHSSIAQWRREHERFWHSIEFRRAIGDSSFTVDDATPVVLERFRCVQLLG